MSSSLLATKTCSDHSQTRALFSCLDCGQSLCHRCVDTRVHGRHSSHSCRRCRGFAIELAVEAEAEARAPAPSSPVLEVLGFPLRGSNWTYWLGCSALLFAAEVLLLLNRLYPAMGMGWRRGRGHALWILLFLYLGFNLLQVIADAARGSRRAPRWLNPFTRDHDLPWSSMGMVIGIGAVAWGPVLAAWFWGGENALAWLALTLVFAFAYLPLALIATALDCAVGFRLDRLPAELARFGPAYLGHALGFAAVTAVFVGGVALALERESWSLLLVHAPAVSYLALASMHGLGGLYLRREGRLGWF